MPSVTDIKLTERSSFYLVGAFGPTLYILGLCGKGQRYACAMYLEMVSERRAAVPIWRALLPSAAVGDAELHAEVSVRSASLRLAPDYFHPFWKVVVGGSYQFPIGSRILAYAEYHYSGFVAAHPEEILALVATPSFVQRFILETYRSSLDTP